jgi:hypothetical protein
LLISLFELRVTVEKLADERVNVFQLLESVIEVAFEPS